MASPPGNSRDGLRGYGYRQLCRVDDAFFIHHRSWWIGEASATRPDPPYEVVGLANKHRIYGYRQTSQINPAPPSAVTTACLLAVTSSHSMTASHSQTSCCPCAFKTDSSCSAKAPSSTPRACCFASSPGTG